MAVVRWAVPLLHPLFELSSVVKLFDFSKHAWSLP